MEIISILSLLIAMLILAATPGPGVFATVARALSSGFIPALWLIIGIITEDIIFLFFAILGLSVVAQAMGELFFLIKVAGGAYLVWLGLKIWRSKTIENQIEIGQKEKHWCSNLVSGLIITLSNPKVILFYCSFLPSFIDLSKLSSTDIIIVSSIVTSILFLVLSSYAFLASSTRQFLSKTKSIKHLNRATGIVMIATGLRVATKAQ